MKVVEFSRHLMAIKEKNPLYDLNQFEMRINGQDITDISYSPENGTLTLWGPPPKEEEENEGED
jgi:hypothetical protein